MNVRLSWGNDRDAWLCRSTETNLLNLARSPVYLCILMKSACARSLAEPYSTHFISLIAPLPSFSFSLIALARARNRRFQLGDSRVMDMNDLQLRRLQRYTHMPELGNTHMYVFTYMSATACGAECNAHARERICNVHQREVSLRLVWKYHGCICDLTPT